MQRRFEVTTDVLADAAVKAALLPDPLGQSFEDLWKQANETLAILSRSRVARNYLLQEIANGPLPNLGIHLGSVLHAPENLFLSYDSDREQGFYLRCIKNGATFEGPFTDYFLGSATAWFKAMQTPTGALRAIFKMFGLPSLTVDDIDVEMKRNGLATVVIISKSGASPHLLEPGATLSKMLQTLQFVPDVQAFNFDEVLKQLDQLQEGNNLFVLELRPGQVTETIALYDAMPGWMKRRLVIHCQLDVYMYENIGYPRVLTAHLTTATLVLSTEFLLQFLNHIWG
ncbi:MAG: hypothetical protein UT32_C0003G0027 [Parcubacteria group bacterium GW2011_GWC2_39_14]|nr:MAG: hypothetical protein UT32_C0003G0027 [Parcubacteria group bacterium GW2011_GWC2_39_14]KKR54976.1 MAG: hypothetical protein UT91_C0006G0027 [Parcubacteria group bacterium GW2011_GWA2_40_23]